MTILQKIQSLLTAANTKTGESDTTLTDAVQTLIDGYGHARSFSGTFTISQASEMPTITHNLGTTKIGGIIYPISEVIGTDTYQCYFAEFINWPDIIEQTEWNFDFSAYNSNQPTEQNVILANEFNRLRVGDSFITPWTTQTYWYQGEHNSKIFRSHLVLTDNTVTINQSGRKFAPATYAFTIWALE